MKTVLIVDDSMLMRRMLKKIVSRLGYTIAGEADDGNVGVDQYKSLSPDIVTMDVTMKEMSGLEALRIINEYDSNAKVVMVSSMSQAPIVKKAMEYGAKGFLTKPFEEKNVGKVLSQL